ncbi:energy transducer TonB, partial [Pelomonas sp. KK5]|uniref:energy transducer TonB n=1 Tax=Pelomonas sp. KK5 TaxID=1855730 RepID=UPI00117E2BC1
EERRAARLRAIVGKQLDAEADRRAAGTSSVRRARLFGRTDANAELVLYAEAWARRIELNPTFEMVRQALQQPHNDPIVTVAVRNDGSIESITFVRSSGAPELDEAIRRVIRSQEHYPAFQPALAVEYDVIEIRRTWRFDMAIRLF